jgi:type I restriction enzyme R subunit
VKAVGNNFRKWIQVMNEAETRAELIDPKLKESGWGVAEGFKIFREYPPDHGRQNLNG